MGHIKIWHYFSLVRQDTKYQYTTTPFLFILKKARPKKQKKNTNINYVIINNSADKNEAFIFLVFS